MNIGQAIRDGQSKTILHIENSMPANTQEDKKEIIEPAGKAGLITEKPNGGGH